LIHGGRFKLFSHAYGAWQMYSIRMRRD